MGRLEYSLCVAIVMYAPVVSYPATAQCAIPKTLFTIVNTLYKPYAKKPDISNPTDDLAAIDHVASPKLKALIQMEIDCGKQTHEVCNLDHDVIIGAQDWYPIPPPGLDAEQTAPYRIVIISHFHNGEEPGTAAFAFMDINHHWVIDDVIDLSGGIRCSLVNQLESKGC